MWRIKINNRPFLACLSTKLMTILLKQTHFETNIFLSTKVIREREKRGFTSYLSALGGDRRLCLKIMPSRENEIYLWKMVFKVGMYSATYESVTAPVGRDEKIRTALRTNQFAGSLPYPLRKNLSETCRNPQPIRARASLYSPEQLYEMSIKVRGNVFIPCCIRD